MIYFQGRKKFVSCPFKMKTSSGVRQCLTVILWMTLLTNVVSYQCGGRLTGKSGEFTSPNYPRYYPYNVECNWEITVPKGNKVRLTFNSFHVSVLVLLA